MRLERTRAAFEGEVHQKAVALSSLTLAMVWMRLDRTIDAFEGEVHQKAVALLSLALAMV